jgi:hypothetical protein
MGTDGYREHRELRVRPSHIVVTFRKEQVSAPAMLLWDKAPDICRAVVEALPMEVRCHHAIYSGSEIAAITPQLPRLPLAEPTSDVDVGDLAYAYLLAQDHYGVESDFAEICWFYDIDARPSMFTGPAEVSVFAKFEDAAELFRVSRLMRTEGAKDLLVTLR